MTRLGSPAQAIMRTLRTGLSQPPGSDLSPLVPLARQALAFIDRGAVNDPATAGEASELAFLLAALLAAGDEHFARQAFGLLFRLGVEGEVLAVIHLEKLPEDQAVSILGSLGVEEKLLFANAFYRRPRPSRPKTDQFCLEIIADVVERVPDELLILLDLLANRHEYPALPVRNALVRGRLGMWLHRLLDMDLSAEQTRYMARVVGRLREPTLIEKLALRLGEMDEVSAETVCFALAETPGVDPAVAAGPLLALLATPEPSLTAAALTALAHCDPAQAAAAAADCIANAPGRTVELAAFLATLPLTAFGQSLRALPAQARQGTLTAVYAILAAAVPRTMEIAARAALKSGIASPDLGQILLNDLAARARAAARPFPPPPPLPGTAVTRQEQKGLWGRVKTMVGGPAGDDADGKTEALRRTLAAGGEINNFQASWVRLDGVQVTGATFSKALFRAANLRQASFAKTTFTNCQFTDVGFEGASFSTVAFRGCRFADCRFSQSMLENVRFDACDLRLCSLASITGRNLAFDAVEAWECDFYGAAVVNLKLTRCRFRGVSLVRAVLHEFSARGALFSDCLFEMAFFPRANLRGVRTKGCYFAGSRFSGATDEPDILGAMAKDEADALAETEMDIPLPSALAAGPGLRLVAACCDAAFFSRDVARRRRALLANNKRRLSWARRRLGEAGAAFVDMMPVLIEAPFVRDASGTRQAPAARIAGYSPDLPAVRHAARHGGRTIADCVSRPLAPIGVEAVYTIGSVGTVAQGAQSDLDVWVCLNEKAASRPDYAAFQEKLETISRQAMAELGLEIHFFCMTVADVRDNVFGYSEDEGYGSAQGCLLKEEFYRTALVVAGRKPAWWCMAPRVTPDVYAKALTGLVRSEPEIAADSLDFGCVQSIAGDEYFGASLWMIVKSLTSPFKSIIKFGLLEKYAAAPGTPELLCDTLKQSIFSNLSGLWHCDPYALLFREVSRHYEAGGQTGAAELLRQAFMQKTGFDPCEEYVGRDGDTLLDHYFPYAPTGGGGCPPPPKREAKTGQANFAAAMALGDAITRYFLRAYERLKERSRELASGGGLTERDQTMLSRRIAASFGRKVGKIMRLPFVRPGHDLFDSLEFGYEEIAPKEKGFVLRAEPRGGDGERGARTRETVRQDASLPRLCAWIVANELYRPGMALGASPLPAPLTLPDVTGLLAAIHDTFPARETFAPPLSWGLAPERITAALIAVNLLAPREERRTVTADVLYATSWGELFHLERVTGLEALDDSPAFFLTGAVETKLDPELRLAMHAPVKSQCPTGRQTRR
ncbi:class I adenylate cyclase [Solidesulfovibrio sp. C21]|uniref:class I adenylate cyclase n=1 Tax=Solidesulfovibrio sp. C21 TaxID=3398613 RepID=UPI0039FC4273